MPTGVDVRPIPADRTLTGMLLAREIDAAYGPRTPRPSAKGHPGIRRLFPDPRAEDERYFAQTGVFPIMHTVSQNDDALGTGRRRCERFRR